MPTPKSPVKVLYKKGKTEVKYTDKVDASKYYIFELNRGALRDVSKFVLKKFKENFYAKFKKRTGNAGASTSYQVLSSKNTKYPRTEIGLAHSHKGKAVKGFYAYFQETGTSKQEQQKILGHSVEDNIAEILKIESQYLSALSLPETQIETMIDEEDMEGTSEEV